MFLYLYPTAAFLLVSRSLQRARNFCAQHAAAEGARVSGSDDAAAAAACATIVILCTSSNVRAAPTFTLLL